MKFDFNHRFEFFWLCVIKGRRNIEIEIELCFLIYLWLNVNCKWNMINWKMIKKGIRSIRKREIFIKKNGEDAGEFICIKN